MMAKKRLMLSVVALAASALLFVFATFAWWQISGVVNIAGGVVSVGDLEVTNTLYVSGDNVIFTETDAIGFHSYPGNTTYYKLTMTNEGNHTVNVKMTLTGFADGYPPEASSTENYAAGRSLLDVTYLDITNTLTAENINYTRMRTLLPSGVDPAEASITLVSEISLPAGESVDVFFSFTIDGDEAGNDYQNLRLDIDSLDVHATA
jgi:hypothetical protein